MARTATSSLSRRAFGGEPACSFTLWNKVRGVRLVVPMSDLDALGRDGQKRDSAEPEACSPDGGPLPMDVRRHASRSAALRFAGKAIARR